MSLPSNKRPTTQPKPHCQAPRRSICCIHTINQQAYPSPTPSAFSTQESANYHQLKRPRFSPIQHLHLQPPSQTNVDQYHHLPLTTDQASLRSGFRHHLQLLSLFTIEHSDIRHSSPCIIHYSLYQPLSTWRTVSTSFATLITNHRRRAQFFNLTSNRRRLVPPRFIINLNQLAGPRPPLPANI